RSKRPFSNHSKDLYLSHIQPLKDVFSSTSIFTRFFNTSLKQDQARQLLLSYTIVSKREPFSRILLCHVSLLSKVGTPCVFSEELSISSEEGEQVYQSLMFSGICGYSEVSFSQCSIQFVTCCSRNWCSPWLKYLLTL